jgi:hypothetical protein
VSSKKEKMRKSGRKRKKLKIALFAEESLNILKITQNIFLIVNVGSLCVVNVAKMK